jgi:hypothetical protein
LGLYLIGLHGHQGSYRSAQIAVALLDSGQEPPRLLVAWHV